MQSCSSGDLRESQRMVQFPGCGIAEVRDVEGVPGMPPGLFQAVKGQRWTDTPAIAVRVDAETAETVTGRRLSVALLLMAGLGPADDPGVHEGNDDPASGIIDT